MPSFEELGLGPELVEALSAEGFEVPTALQREALPIVRRGTSVAAAAGPGSGTLVAYGAALLDRLETGGGMPRGIVIVPTSSVGGDLARSLARLARSSGHRVGALGAAWALPERSDILFATPDDLLLSISESRVKLDAVEAFVVDQAATIQQISGLETVKTIIEFLPPDGQRVIFSLPQTPEVEAFARANLRKAVHLPGGPPAAESPDRGTLRFQVVGESGGEEILEIIAPLLEADIHHVLVFFRTEDQAADVGDFLGLHGFRPGAPGDPDTPVWLGIDEAEGRDALRSAGESSMIEAISFDVPPDADSLDRRHGAGIGGIVLARARELPHLKHIAREAGYRLVPAPSPAPSRIGNDLRAFRNLLEEALETEDLAPHLLLLEPLFSVYSAAEVAAAAAALLRRGGVPERGAGAPEPDAASVPLQPRPSRAPAWVHLFMSLGSRDGIGPGDLVGAITGEAGIPGSKVGKIEIRDTFSRVEIEESVAGQVIKALNGVTVKGRSVRVDFDRQETKRGAGRGGGARAGTRPGPRQRRSQATAARDPEPGSSAGRGQEGERSAARPPTEEEIERAGEQ